MEVKKYKPLFKESTKKVTLKESFSRLKEAQKKIKKMREEDEIEVDEVKEIIDNLDDIISDAIDSVGAASPIVDELVDTAQNLDIQADVEDEEEIFVEEDESDDEDEKDEVFDEMNEKKAGEFKVFGRKYQIKRLKDDKEDEKEED